MPYLFSIYAADSRLYTVYLYIVIELNVPHKLSSHSVPIFTNTYIIYDTSNYDPLTEFNSFASEERWKKISKNRIDTFTGHIHKPNSILTK